MPIWSRPTASRSRPEPDYLRPRDPEWAFMVTGFSECIDSFFAFGLFALAKRSGFFPPALVETFEPVMQEEGRHILFFVNWVAWHRRNLPWWRRPLVRSQGARGLGFSDLGADRHRPRRRQGAAPAPGDAAGQQLHHDRQQVAGRVDLSAAALIDICLAENDRRLAGYDPRLLRPNCRAAPDALRPPPGAAGGGNRRGRAMKIGSEEHKERFCRQFIGSHNTYRPEALPWPDLDDRGAGAAARDAVLAGGALYRAARRRDRRRVCGDRSTIRWCARRWCCRASRRRATPSCCG